MLERHIFDNFLTPNSWIGGFLPPSSLAAWNPMHPLVRKSYIKGKHYVKKQIKTAGIVAIIGLAATSFSASAWWGGGPWSNNGWGDGTGDFDMSFSGRGSGAGRGYGYRHPYGYGYPYGGYGYGAPYGAPYGGYGYGAPYGAPYGGYGAPYGVPGAPAAPAAQ